MSATILLFFLLLAIVVLAKTADLRTANAGSATVVLVSSSLRKQPATPILRSLANVDVETQRHESVPAIRSDGLIKQLK